MKIKFINGLIAYNAHYNGAMRTSLLAVCLFFTALAWGQTATVPDAAISGKLKDTPAGPVLATPKGDIVIEADPDSTAVLHDTRIQGLQLEAHGKFRDATHFELNPFHTKPLLVVQNGHKREVTYWCDVCSIRTYTPGKCLCCQAETALDLKDQEKR